MNLHPFVSACIVAAAMCIFVCCADFSHGNKYVRVCRIDPSKEECYEFRDARFIHGNKMLWIRDQDGNEYSFNKYGWSILIIEKKDRKSR